MKYTIEELQFAESVRAFATAMRTGARPKAETGQWDSPEFTRALAKWDAENPVSSFVPAALGRIKEVADIIRVNLKQE